MSELALQLIHEAKQNHLTTLDLGKCGLTELPDELFELNKLENLILSDIYWEYNSKNDKWERKQSSNKDTKNQIEFLPIQFEKLHTLRKLFLFDNQISDLSSLSTLKTLELLDLNNNKISDLSPLTSLTSLNGLYLGNNNISDLSPLSILTSLNRLGLFNNNISNLSPLATLTSLNILGLLKNQIYDLSFLTTLTSLSILDLSINQISDLSPLTTLTSLKELYLGYNEIHDLSSLSILTNLNKVNLEGNQISDLSPLTNLIEKDIPVHVIKQQSRKEIIVGKNLLQHPPEEIIEQGNEAILTYFRNLEEQGKEKLNEAKLIIVGEPGAGKTTLVKKLFDPNFQLSNETESTLGVEVHAGWQFTHPEKLDTKFTANIWDFGGQQIQYMTHQFFLTPSAIYVLVSANDRKEPTNFPYWFKIIHLLGEEKNQYSPVLVVLNEKDDKFINKFNFDRKFYEERYPELQIEVCDVDLKKIDGRYQALQEKLEEMLTCLPHINVDRPARWRDIQQALHKESKGSDHISFTRYVEICVENSVKDGESQILFSRYLHKLGTLLHFVDDPILHDFIILNPQWAVDAVYSVLIDNEITRNNGSFTQEKLFSVWKKYNRTERLNLLNLMKQDNFEICYELDDKPGTFIAPQLLSDTRPDLNWNKKENLKFRFQYKFMPEGIITRFIVRMNALIEKKDGIDLVWHKGVILKRNDCRARVLEEENKDGLKVIDISISGKESERKFLLHSIREEIEKIHQKWFKNIQAEQMVPCNCEICLQETTPTYFEFNELQQYQEEGELTIKCRKGGLKDVSVRPLLEGIFEKKELQQQEQKHRDQSINITFNTPSSIEQTTQSTTTTTEAEKTTTLEKIHEKWWIVVLIFITGIITAFGEQLVSWLLEILNHKPQ